MPRKYVLFNVAVSVFTCIRVVEIEFCFDQYVIILQFRAIAFSCYFYLHYSLRRILYLSYPFMCDYLSAKYYYNMHFHISLTKTLLPLIYYCYYAFKQFISRSYDLLASKLLCCFPSHEHSLSLIYRILSKMSLLLPLVPFYVSVFFLHYALLKHFRRHVFLSLLLNTHTYRLSENFGLQYYNCSSFISYL